MGLQENLQGHKLDVKWFTDGEFLWRSGASIAWLIISLPAAVFIFYGVVSLNIFHPITWVSGMLSIIFEIHFWMAVILFGSIASFLAVSKLKFNSVQDVVHYSRVSTLLYLLHPARLLHVWVHIPCGVLAVWFLSWMLNHPFNALTIVKPESDDEYFLNEHGVFLVTFGGWLGFYASVQYFVSKEFLFTFPNVQQKRFFLVKSAVFPCIYKAIILTLRASRWYYFLYFIAGNIPRDCAGSFLAATINRDAVPLNSIYGLLDIYMLWVVLSVGTLLSFVWIFGNKLYVIYNTQAYTFAIESAIATGKDHCLPAVVKETSAPLLRHLAFLDLCQLSQFSSRRRKQIFCLTQPGGRPANWNSISDECLSMLDEMTAAVTTSVEYQLHVQQYTAEHRSFVGTPGSLTHGHVMSPALTSPVGVTTCTTPHGTPSTVSHRPRLWSALQGESTMSKSPAVQREMNGNITNATKPHHLVDQGHVKWKIQLVPHYIAQFFKERPVIGLLFNELPDYRTKAIFSGCQQHIWAIEGLSRLVVASFKEDTFGVVQKTLPDILSSLLALLQALDRYAKFPSTGMKSSTIQPRPPRPQGAEGMRHQLRTTLTSSIYRITNTFHDHLYGIPLTQDHRNRLQSFMDFKE